jgi:ribonuclease-3
MSEERGAMAGAREVGDPVTALEARLGLTFADRATALAAVTHKSYVNEHRDEPGLVDNERLEFLGDAVIDLAVSHRLMERFPEAREGDLSKMRAAVVDELGLCEMARALDLGALLRLGRGEELTGGRQKASLLADAMEAVIAAVFVEAGLAPVLQIADRFLGEAFARATAGTLDRDFKTQLQEIAQSRLRSTPRYRVVGERGPDHSKIFEVETELRGEVLGRGVGRSKKDAEQAAAKLALEALARRGAEAAAAGAAPAPAALAEPHDDAPQEPAPPAAQPPLPPEAQAAPPAPPAVAAASAADPEPAPAAEDARPARRKPRASRKQAAKKPPARKVARVSAPRRGAKPASVKPGVKARAGSRKRGRV